MIVHNFNCLSRPGFSKGSAVHVETNALIVLACDWHSIDEDGDLLVSSMIKGRTGAEATVLTIPSGKEVGVDVEPSSEG